jgi:tetratricopeptide (TPR) repeat protein
MERGWRWLRGRSAVELAALAAGLAVFGYVGWDSALWDPRLQLLLHLLAVGAILALAMAALRGEELPRTPIDLPLLGLVACLGLATVSALNIGMSLRAMGSIVAFALALPLALLAVRHRPTWVGLLASVPVLLFSIPTLAVMLWRRIEWVLVGAPGLPPLRMESEGTPFGSVALPPFVIWPAWALAGLIEDSAWRRPIRIGLVAVGIPLTILSGSRSAWLAIGVTAIVAGVPWLWTRRRRLGSLRDLRGRSLLLAIGAALFGLLVVALVVPRLTVVASLLYRVGLWRDTLRAWATDPVLGIGPGFMPYARQAAAPDFSFPVRQPHSHNLPLGVLGDAGLLGLGMAIVVVVTLAWVAGPWRMRTPTGRAAALVLVGLAVGGLTEDLTFLPNFNLLAILLVAVVLTDARAVRWAPLMARRLVIAAPAAAAGLALLVAMVVSDAGAVAHWIGLHEGAGRNWAPAVAWFERAEQLDPWHPTIPKSLAVVADADGDDALARRAAETAVARNSGDGSSWLNLALACETLGDRTCREAALERTVATGSFGGPETANAALGYDELGQAAPADSAFRRAILVQRLTTLAIDWPRTVAIGDAMLPEDFGSILELNRLLGWWAMGEPIDPATIADPGTRAVAHAMRGEVEEADAWLERAIDAAPAESITWELAIALRDHWGRSTQREQEIAEVVRGGPFPPRTGGSPLPTITWDVASFRGYPIDGLGLAANRVVPEVPWPWALQETLP